MMGSGRREKKEAVLLKEGASVGLSLVAITAQKMNERAFAQAERAVYSRSDANKGSVFCLFQGSCLKRLKSFGKG